MAPHAPARSGAALARCGSGGAKFDPAVALSLSPEVRWGLAGATAPERNAMLPLMIGLGAPVFAVIAYAQLQPSHALPRELRRTQIRLESVRMP
jgi:hypothetical protein